MGHSEPSKPSCTVGLEIDRPDSLKIPINTLYGNESTDSVDFVGSDRKWHGGGENPSNAGTVFISPTGNDAAKGTTQATPKRTLKAALDTKAGTIICAPGNYLAEPDDVQQIATRTIRIVGGILDNLGNLTKSFVSVPGAPTGGVVATPDPNGVLVDGFSGALVNNECRGFIFFVDDASFPGGVVRTVVSNTAGVSPVANLTLQEPYPDPGGIPAGLVYGLGKPAVTIQLSVGPVGSQLRFVGSAGGVNFWSSAMDGVGDSGPGAVVQMYAIALDCPIPPAGRCLSAQNGVGLFLCACTISENNCFVAATQNSQINGTLALNPRPSVRFPGFPLSILDDLGIGAGNSGCGVASYTANDGSSPGLANLFADDHSLISGFWLGQNINVIAARDDSTLILIGSNWLDLGGFEGDDSILLLGESPGCSTTYTRTKPAISPVFFLSDSEIRVDHPIVQSLAGAAPNPFPAYLSDGRSAIVETSFFAPGTSQITSVGNVVGVEIQGQSIGHFSPRTVSAGFVGATTAELEMGFGPSNTLTTFTALQLATQLTTADGNVANVDQP